MKNRCDIKIAAVVVTYNRLNKLKKALKSYDEQLHHVDYMIVVDNASTDDTADWLDKWKNESHKFFVEIIHSKENLGGSGGFYLGQEKAMELDVDWILIADDDAYLPENYISGLYEYIVTHDTDDVSVLCGLVEEHNSYDNKHRMILKKNTCQFDFFEKPSKLSYQEPFFYIDTVSYVGSFINKNKLLKAGLVENDFFIWFDDTEHSLRLRKVGKIICLPNLVIKHDVEKSNKELSWKSYYGFRNRLICHKKHFKITFPLVLLLFFAKTFLSPLRGHSLAEVKMRLVAIKDAVLGNMGVHKIYKPGWKPDR